MPLQDFRYLVKKFAINGATTNKIIESGLLEQVIKFKPHCCFVQIEGNNIYKGCNIKTITNNIEHIYNKLNMADIQTYFREILVRGNTKHIEEKEYNKVRSIINQVLRNKKFKNLNVLLHINLQKTFKKRSCTFK